MKIKQTLPKITLRRIKNRFNRLLRQVKMFIGTFFYKLFLLEHPMQEKLRMSALDEAVAFAVNNQVKGDYLEFGVYKGKSFIRAYKKFRDHIERHREYSLPRFLAFDSFEGLPGSDIKDRPVQYQEGAYSFPEKKFVKQALLGGMPKSSLIIVPGFYNNSLIKETKQKHDIKQASVIYIDCDIYESAVPVFNFITDIVQSGTTIVIDDWFRYRGQPTAGIQRACNEWLKDNPHIQLMRLHTWERVAFVVFIND